MPKIQIKQGSGKTPSKKTASKKKQPNIKGYSVKKVKK